LADPTAVCYAHSMNLCEVYYQGIRRNGIPAAKLAIESLFMDGVIELRDMSRPFWRRVGKLKAAGYPYPIAFVFLWLRNSQVKS
jgi:hypothetical protein